MEVGICTHMTVRSFRGFSMANGTDTGYPTPLLCIKSLGLPGEGSWTPVTSRTVGHAPFVVTDPTIPNPDTFESFGIGRLATPGSSS